MHTPATNRDKHHRFPGESISHGVWLYDRFYLSDRDVEERLFVRSIAVTDEAIRKWCRTFGQQYANQLRRRRPRLGDTWHLDEVFLTINGEWHSLWRAVDQDGNVLDILVQRRRDTIAAKKFFRKRLKGCQYVPRVIVTDTLQSSSELPRSSSLLVRAARDGCGMMGDDGGWTPPADHGPAATPRRRGGPLRVLVSEWR
jgi:putative transposase